MVDSFSAFFHKMADGSFISESFSSLTSTATSMTRSQTKEEALNKDSKHFTIGSNIKITSAIVLVERSKIACIEAKKKIKIPNANYAEIKKDSKKDKDKNNCMIENRKENTEGDAIKVNDKDSVKRAEFLIANVAVEDSNAQQQQEIKEFRDERQEDLGIGPSAKKRCTDRYDSSGSSDSGVVVSCGDCSSTVCKSNTSAQSSSDSSTSGSDIAEPGSPSSTSSDEGISEVQSTGGKCVNNISIEKHQQSGGKLAPTQQQNSSSPLAPRLQWPWTPPLATTACLNSYKIFKPELEHEYLLRQADLSPKVAKPSIAIKQQQQNHHHHNHHNHHHHHRQNTQGKITEYFKTQIKPQQSKIKKNLENEMSILVTKNSSEFRRPATVHRNSKNTLDKYHLGTHNNSCTSDWKMCTLSQGINTLHPQLKYHHDKKLTTSTMSNSVTITITTTTTTSTSSGISALSIPRDVFSTIPSCKISSLRIISEASPSESPPPISLTSTNLLSQQSNQHNDILFSQQSTHANENNKLTSNHYSKGAGLLSRLSVPSIPNSSVKDEDDEEDSSRDSAETKISSLTSLSPILSAPKTIRFPAKLPNKDRAQTTESGFCRWDKCGMNYDTSSTLLEHLQTEHINTQTGGDNFVCHWQGCKVQGRTSCSRRWLERHVLSHGGNKPFQCIVDGCGNRFSSQTALERHVNGHFNQSETNSSTSKRNNDIGGKLVRRNGKKLRYRRQPWSARIFDYFDSGVMEGLQHRLLELAKTRTQGQLSETPGDSMTLTSQVLGKRVELDGKTKVLLRWYPQDIEPDEWVLESDIRNFKHVTIRSVATKLPEEMNIVLYPAVKGIRPLLQQLKHRRKPIRNS